MKIKAVVNVISSEPDVYGNRYHMATVTNTKNGKSLTFITDTETNLEHRLRKAYDSWEAFTVSHSTVPKRHYKNLTAKLPYEHNIDFYTLLGLQKPEMPY